MKNTMMPEIGSRAPSFSGPVQGGGTVALQDFKGKKLALYFYPEDDTPTCTTQACNLRDNFAELRRHGIAIVGVSADDQSSHERFAEKFSLPFPLIADPNRDICNAFGVFGDKNLYGRIFKGIKRTTFLIDEKQTIVHVFKRPKSGRHAAEIIEKFSETS